MATLPITIAKGSQTGALLRRLAMQIERMALDVPDIVSTGADTVLTIDNAPAAGTASIQITAGPYTSSLYQI